MRSVLTRAAVAVASTGFLAALTWMPTSAVSASPDFVCMQELQQACTIVFGPLCKPHGCG